MLKHHKKREEKERTDVSPASHHQSAHLATIKGPLSHSSNRSEEESVFFSDLSQMESTTAVNSRSVCPASVGEGLKRLVRV